MSGDNLLHRVGVQLDGGACGASGEHGGMPVLPRAGYLGGVS
jgi:hypothetical protein